MFEHMRSRVRIKIRIRFSVQLVSWFALVHTTFDFHCHAAISVEVKLADSCFKA